MTRRFSAPILALLLLLMMVAGCAESDLGGVRVPNSRPETELTGQPPSLLEAGFVCEFNWKGADVDGKVVGFQWKISNNGTDGISPRDTMTFDPISGAMVNPWRYTTANDSVFYVLADQPDFPGDPNGDARSFRTHTIFIRAVDDKGAVDPTPAHMSFTSTTLLPTCRAVFPQLGGTSAKTVPPTLNIGWEGTDPDFDLNVPVKARFLWVPAYTPNGDEIQVKSMYETWRDELIDFEDPAWSEWIDYADNETERRVSFPDLEGSTLWLFAVQVQDTAGAVSIGKDYQVEVANVSVSELAYYPQVSLQEVYLGTAANTSPTDQIAAGQPLNFSWTADASAYNGNIVSFQHGWNVTTLDLVTDPGWAIGPGLSDQNRMAEQRSFTAGGLNYFYLKVIDDSKKEVIYKWTLDVVPFVPYGDQDPLLVIDQIVDHNTGKWTDRYGNARDSEEYRNEYWRFLEGDNGVQNFSWDVDFIDHSDLVEYADIVGYKALLIYARAHTQQYMLSEFRAVNNVDRFVYLTPYQTQGGNLFLVGSSSLDSFIETKNNYYVPTVFDTRETPLNGYETSFGWKELPDGTEVERGPLMYHYTTAGIAALDWTANPAKTIYSRNQKTPNDRSPQCVGLKALALDPEFKQQHLIGPGVLADTVATDATIDWREYDSMLNGSLQLETSDYAHADDEFIDSNISPRTTPILTQDCENAPGGKCIEPMYRGIARFDWLSEIRRSEGETSWPYSRYSDIDLQDDYCGLLALAALDTLNLGRARTNGQTFGWMSYKMVEDKASGKADVYWGFDPYRFDEEDTQKAILWVLEYFGLEIK